MPSFILENFSEPIELTHKGLGSAQILHGYPDSRVRAKSSEIHLIKKMLVLIKKMMVKKMMVKKMLVIQD